MSPLVQLIGIAKSYSGQRVLDGVDFDIRAGEVHVLAGENGAGKSTLIRVLGGVITPDAGEIRIAGRSVRLRSVPDARRAGIAVMHQELSLAPSLSIADNLFLGRERATVGGVFGAVRSREQSRLARAALARVGLDADPSRPVGSLPLAARQLVEIAKALSADARVIVMDEPTSALPAADARRLFALIDGLRAAGAGIVYITHRMEEIYRLTADGGRITVLRDGRRIATAPSAELPPDALVRAMVGRPLSEQIARRAPAPGEEVLRVESLRARGRAGLSLDGVSFALRAGEVLGLAGLQGSGISLLLHCLFGDTRTGTVEGGRVHVPGVDGAARTPRGGIRRRLALLTADRKQTGLNLGMSVQENATLASLPALSPLGVRRPRRERAAADETVRSLAIRCRSLNQAAATLSGGNQQKVALGKWAMTRPRIMLLDDPTRGIDVGAKHEVYELINRWTAEGMAIVLTSGELPELLGLSDRVLVMHRGRITAELGRADATPERVMAAAMGGPPA